MVNLRNYYQSKKYRVPFQALLHPKVLTKKKLILVRVKLIASLMFVEVIVILFLTIPYPIPYSVQLLHLPLLLSIASSSLLFILFSSL